MPPYPRYRIDDALMRRARILGDGRWNIPPDGATDLFHDIRRRAARDGCTPRELLWREAMAGDVSSPAGGALYWGYLDPVDTTVENHFVALAWAERHNDRHPDRPVVTFWTTAGPAALNPVNRLNDVQRKALGFEWEFLIRVWESMCLRFADESAGETLVFGTYFHPRVILGRTEIPGLRRNRRVGPDRIHFVHPPPERLSDGRLLTDDLRDVLSAPGNQACIQFDAPHEPGFLDVGAVARLPHRVIAEQVAALRAGVEEADRRWRPLPITPECPAGIPWYPPIVERAAAGSRREAGPARPSAPVG